MKHCLIVAAMLFLQLFVSCDTSSPEVDVWYAMEQRVKAEMKNPSSFEEEEHKVIAVGDDEYVVKLTFYGTNSFGAKVINVATARAHWSENSTRIYDFEVR